jgi:hypothetical protein
MEGTEMENKAMTMDQLEQVAGGTYGEYEDIAKMIQAAEMKKSPGHIVEMMSTKQVKAWLQSNCNIDADFNILIDQPVVRKFDTLLNNAAEYKSNGRVLSHRQVLDIVAAKLK